MQLIIHEPGVGNTLSSHYEQVFESALELFVVTAYLTEWDSNLRLNPDCQRFRLIVGCDFGITRKAACEKVMKWLPPKLKWQFMVADGIGGFHPKAVFWKDKKGKCFAIVGSSNLTRAAFVSNYEVNVLSQLSEADYSRCKTWVRHIEKRSVVVSEDWLKGYNEALWAQRGGTKGSGEVRPTPVVLLKLPSPPGMTKQLVARREKLAKYRKQMISLEALFRRCARREISSKEFYEQLQKYWSYDIGDRLQGAGWEIRGKHGDFQLFSKSFVKILDAADDDRDSVVSEEIDKLSEHQVPMRGAFLSEMLCLRFPEDYPVLNDPVQRFLKAVKYRGPRRASEGARFLYLAKALRASLRQNPDHPARTLAELDTVIWLA